MKRNDGPMDYQGVMDLLQQAPWADKAGPYLQRRFAQATVFLLKRDSEKGIRLAEATREIARLKGENVEEAAQKKWQNEVKRKG